MNDEDDKVTAKTAKSDGPSKKPKTNVASKMKGKRKLVVPKEEQEDVEMDGPVASLPPSSETEPDPVEEEDPDEGEDEIDDEEDGAASQRFVYLHHFNANSLI